MVKIKIINEVANYYEEMLLSLRESLDSKKVSHPIVIQRLKTEKRMIEMFLEDLNQISERQK